MVVLMVKKFYNRRLMDSIIVDVSEPLDKTIRRLYKNPRLKGVFLVTPENKLYGTVTRHDLLGFLRTQLGSSPWSTDKIVAILKKAQAKEVVHKFSYAASLTPETSIDEALKAMVMLDLVDMPVVDKQRKIIGEITLTMILSGMLQASRNKKARK
ncbi:MAG: CBS domain-containing protein [Candidatus Bathyarchaeota archaeon]